MSALLNVYPRMDLDLERAEGNLLYLADGRVLLDLYGGHAVCPLGHAHPALHEALVRQHATLDFYSNSLRMAVQERAAAALLGDTTHLARVHFVSTGTEANESAIHLARKLTGRQRIVSLLEGFHGRTLGSLSVTGLPAYRARVPVPVPEAWVGHIGLNDSDLSAIDETVAGVLVESVPSLGGVFLPDPGWLEAVQRRCHEVGALFILDEVQGGIGRLGRWWGHHALGQAQPDIVTLAKSIGGGFPVAAMVTTEAVGAQVTYGELGTTFGGGPMACAMVETVARVVREEGLTQRVVELEARLRAGLAGVAGVEVRGKGALLGVQTPMPQGQLRDALLERGIVVGASGQSHTVRLLPAYNTPFEQVDRFLEALVEVLHG